jgi:hypothetical protein
MLDRMCFTSDMAYDVYLEVRRDALRWRKFRELDWYARMYEVADAGAKAGDVDRAIDEWKEPT